MRKTKPGPALDWAELFLVAMGIAIIGVHVVLAVTQSVGRWDNISCAGAWAATILWVVIARGWRRRARKLLESWRQLVEGP